MGAESSVPGVGDSSDEALESDEDDVQDIQALNFPGRVWTAEAYSNARSINQFHEDKDTNVMFFHIQVQQDTYFGHMVKKIVFKHQTIDLEYI